MIGGVYLGEVPPGGDFATTGSTYTDTGSGNIVVTGTATEAKSYADSRTATIAVSGTRSESASFTTSRTGQIVVSGTRSEAFTATSSGTVTIIVSGTATESWLQSQPQVAVGRIEPSGGATTEEATSGVTALIG